MLAQYEADTRELIRDTGPNPFVTTQRLDRWINVSRRTAAKLTGCIRVLVSGQGAYGVQAQPGFFTPGAAVPGNLPDAQPFSGGVGGLAAVNAFSTIPGVEFYPFKYGNDAMKAQYAGLDGIVDVINIAVSWGASRPVLDWWPWDELQAYARSYNVGTFSYPGIFSTNGDGAAGNVWLFPGPSIASEMEWDVFALPAILGSDETPEAIPPAFRDAIKFGAAGLSLLNSRPGMSQVYYGMFQDALGIDRLASDRGKTSSYYYMG